MALLRVEAEKLSNNQLVSGVIEEIIDKDELFALLPFMGVNGKAYVYNRENTISEGDFLDPVNDTVNEEASTFTEVTANLRVLAGDVDVDKFLDATMGDHNSQKAIQIAQKAKGLARKFRRTLAIGDNGTNAKEFDGVASLVTGGQTITAGANGAPITLTMLDELLDAVPNGADAIMMRSGTLRAYRALLRAMGGTLPESIMIENFGRAVPGHNGIPIIVNDFLPIDEVQGTETAATSIYAMRLNEVDGLHAIYGGSSAGIVVEDIGTVQNKDATRTRLKWYCGTALKSTKSLARIQGIQNI
ncbi:MAG: phage major capsid protein [Piscirickettsiaceae bacterium]|nr:phage major capsid protein [Piscirickettsiaceae bacterium]